MEHIIDLPQDKYFIVKLLKVPIELDLYEIVDALKGKLRSILSIFRVFDYVNQRRCDDVVVVLRDEMEYKTLDVMRIIFVKNHEIHLEFRYWCFGAASRPKCIVGSNFNELIPSPVSLKISNLTEVSRITSIYLSKILIAFESSNQKDVTGISFLYNDKRDSIRPFGFVAFSNAKSMLKFHKQRVRVWEEILFCEESLRVPVLLSEHNKTMLKPNPAQFSEDVCNANLLSGTALLRVASNSSLFNAVEAMEINKDNEKSIQEEKDDESDKESILSINCDYDIDEDLNLVKK